ncbi:TauD/TfdA family dioxygenase [Actinomycetes bacterium KLBMP 9759]
MKPFHVLADAEREELRDTANAVSKNPYEDYPAFSSAVRDVIDRGAVPAFFTDACARIRAERAAGTSEVHVLRNCPIDAVVPDLDLDDPVADKYRKKTTFLGEVLLELFGQLCATPLLAYGSRNNGDFFTDVIAINRYSGQQTGFSDSELVFHNDRTAHDVRADYTALLGLRCPEGDYIYTGFVSGAQLLAQLDEREQKALREPWFNTPFDVFSRDTNSAQTVSEKHAIFVGERGVRYLDTTTTVAPDSPPEAKDALLAMKNALVRAPKTRHRILTGDLFTFANQDGLHNREKIEINDPDRAKQRWLLKTYAFRDDAAADRHAHRWLGGVRGRVAD